MIPALRLTGTKQEEGEIIGQPAMARARWALLPGIVLALASGGAVGVQRAAVTPDAADRQPASVEMETTSGHLSSVARHGQAVRVMALDPATVFLSTQHSNEIVSAIGWIDGALFLDEQRFAFMDGDTRRVHYVDLRHDQIVSAGGNDYIPDAGSTLLDRDSAGGVIVIEPYGATGLLTRFDANGEIEHVAETGFVGPVDWNPVGVLPNRTLILSHPKDTDAFSLQSLFTVSDNDVFRMPTRFEMRSAEGITVEFAEALGDQAQSMSVIEGRRGSTRTVRIIFGHRLLASRAGEYVAIAQTDRDSIQIYDRVGRLVSHIPMPLARATPRSKETLVAQRSLRLREHRDGNRARIAARNRALSEAFVRFGVSPDLEFLSQSDSTRLARVEVNGEVPPIDRLHGDDDGRLWIRRFSIAGDALLVWEVWNPHPPVLEFYVHMTQGERLMDARDNKVLVLIDDESTGRDYIAIKTLIEGDEGALPARQTVGLRHQLSARQRTKMGSPGVAWFCSWDDYGFSC